MKNPFLIILVFIFSFGPIFSQIPERAEDVLPLQIGEKIPAIEIKSANNKLVLLPELIKDQKTILLFYRGGWCPYCNKHLSAVGESLDEINKLGYQIIAVSPDSPEELKNSIDKNKLSYSLYSDSTNKLSSAMGIAFKAPERYTSKLLKYSDDINPDILPVPSIFILDTNGVILFEYVNTDYKKRISQEELLTALKELN